MNEIDEPVAREPVDIEMRPHPLRLAMPYGAGETHDWTWARIAWALDLPHPAPSGLWRSAPLSSEQVEVLDRFCDCALEMAGSSFLNAGASVSLKSNREGELVDIAGDWPSRESTRSFAVLLRQCHSDPEAGFSTVRNILSASLRQAGASEEVALLKQWKAARASLCRAPFYSLMEEKLGWASGSLGRVISSPEKLLAEYNYGELIHWGEHRSAHREASKDPVLASLRHLDFLCVATQFSHLYMSFAALVKGREILNLLDRDFWSIGDGTYDEDDAA